MEFGFEDDECLPRSFMPIFKKHISDYEMTTTGAKPVGKFKLADATYFLVVVQQDDYGPIYYGLTYNIEKKYHSAK
jgi:hypothetical protein